MSPSVKTMTVTPSRDTRTIDWVNTGMILGVHFGALYGIIYISPWSTVSTKTVILTFFMWMFSGFGITMGYHRLWSHRSFQASLIVRVVLALLGAIAIQRSIKWWCIRHRLHHRFTDDPIHDPYAACRGLFFSHIGWIFYRSEYPRIKSVEKGDLERDPVVVFQAKYYYPLAITFGFIFPALVGRLWDDGLGAFIWGALVHKIAIWHTTFLVNSLAHWKGLQGYSDETTAKGNSIMAIVTLGEGNHNFHHAFPYDFRAGPGFFDIDPSKWLIIWFARMGLVSHLKEANKKDIQYAMEYMETKYRIQALRSSGEKASIPMHEGQLDLPWTGSIWDREKAEEYIKSSPNRCFLIIYDYLVDATTFQKDHPGGSGIFRPYSVRVQQGEIIWQDATWAFKTHNQHTSMARRRLRQLALAKILERE